MMNAENRETSLGHENGKELLGRLLFAIRKQDANALRVAMDSLQNAIDEKKMCTPLPDTDLQELLKEGEITLYVGTGSAGERIFIEKNRLYMPVSEHDLKYGYGKRCQDNFRRLFNIPEGQELLVSF